MMSLTFESIEVISYCLTTPLNYLKQVGIVSSQAFRIPLEVIFREMLNILTP